MKRISHSTLFIAVMLIASLMTISSCTKSPIVIHYNLNDMNICIPANPYQTYQVYTFPLKTSDVQAFLKSAGGTTDISKVSSAVVNGFTAEIVTTGSDFSQISSVEVYMKLASDTSSTSVGSQVAYSQNLGAGIKQSKLLLNGVDIRQALSNDMTITVKVLDVPTGNAAVCMKLTEGVIALKVSQ